MDYCYICSMITIYKITNPKDKIYVGQTKDFNKRKNLYKILHCHKQKKLYASLKKYGFMNHIFEVLEIIPIPISDEREIYWIDFYGSYYKGVNKGLNLILGGRSRALTPEDKLHLSLLNKGGKHPKAKKLYQYSITGELIKIWDCMKDIERELNFKTTCLSRACKLNRVSYGYNWSYFPKH